MPSEPHDAPDDDTVDSDAKPASSVDPSDHSPSSDKVRDNTAAQPPGSGRPKEYGGPKGPDPVRYGDWEKNGRCIDF